MRPLVLTDERAAILTVDIITPVVGDLIFGDNCGANPERCLRHGRKTPAHLKRRWVSNKLHAPGGAFINFRRKYGKDDKSGSNRCRGSHDRG